MDSLTREQIGELQQDLQDLERELRVQLESSEDGARPVDLDEPMGRLSRMDALQQQHMTQANRKTAQLRLKQVEAALRRCEEGGYGACLSCEEEVGFPRLKARPESPFCISCQSSREQR